MATPNAPEQQASPDITDAFVADRAKFWGTFTKFVTGASIVVALLLVGMAIFLT